AAGVNDGFILIGRILIAIIFIMSGFEKFMDLAGTAATIGSKNLPLPYVAAVVTAIVELGGGVLVVIGWQTRIVSLLLALFTAAAAYFFHDFWHETGDEATNNMVHFLKNVSIVGGFLMLAGAGAGRFSFDGACIRPEYLRRGVS